MYSEDTNKKIQPGTGLSLEFCDDCLGTIEGFLERIELGEPPRTIVIAKGFFTHASVPHYEDYMRDRGYVIDSYLTPQSIPRINQINTLVDELNRAVSGVTKVSDPKSQEVREEYRILADLTSRIRSIVTGREEKRPDCR